MPSLDIGENRIDYAILRGAGRHYTYFKFRPDLTLEVVLPRGRRGDAESAIKRKLPWILAERRRLSRARRVLEEGSVMYGGLRMKIVQSNGPGMALSVDEASKEVRVTAEGPASVRELVRRWFLKESSAYVTRKVKELSPRLGVRPSKVDVREIGKWGYCTRTGRLSFSWQLIALPERLREYVVLHELSHLAEFNHSRAFKNKLLSVCPDYRERERELNDFIPYEPSARRPQQT
ncbi:MAG: DUF45 domain-containing protein [archaeon]|nr:MAG: DUF45 domain-containing protein [archaeon]